MIRMLNNSTIIVRFHYPEIALAFVFHRRNYATTGCRQSAVMYSMLGDGMLSTSLAIRHQ